METEPRALVGKPIIRGTRIAVELIVDLMARGYTREAGAPGSLRGF
jgi:uncharacterized protein (DUF433 family)